MARSPSFPKSASISSARDITGDGAFGVRVDSEKVLRNLETLQETITKSLNEVTPVFGAFMPYSFYAEYGNSRGMAPSPAVVTGLLKNMGYINTELSAGLLQMLDRQMNNGSRRTRVSSEQIADLWESILNSGPANDAKIMARYKYGYHRGSIAGYARPNGVEQAVETGKRLNEERKALVRRMASKAAKRRSSYIAKRYGSR